MNRRIIITAIPIIGVNLTAIFAQFQFWHAHLPTWGIPGQLLFALALESVSVMLCYFAHLSMVSTDSAFKLRLGAILFALAIATMNGSHYVTRAGAITAASVGVFACSAMSPILWGVYSRRQSRDTLISNGLIEGRSVRLGSARWLFHPRRSFNVFSLAVWRGEQNPQTAITAYENETASISVPVMLALPEPALPEPALPEPALPEPALPEPALPEPARARRAAQTGSKAALVRSALDDAPADSAPVIAARLAARGISVSPAYVRQVKSLGARRTIAARRDSMRALNSGASSKHAPANANQDE